MKSKHTFSIDFITRKCKADKTRADIFARITVDGDKPREIGLKEQIDTKAWDNSSETVRGKSIEIKAINTHIEDVRSRIREKYRELERNNELITADSVKAAYLGIQQKLEGFKTADVLNVLGCSPNTLKALRVQRKLRTKKIMGTVYYHKDVIKKLMLEGFS